jgi:hypothetical protein
MLCLLRLFTSAQDSSSSPLSLDYLDKLSSRIEGVSKKLDSKTEKTLTSLEKQDQKIYRKLLKKDSTKAKAFLAGSKQKFQSLEQKLKSATIPSHYNAYLDTLKTSLKFLQGSPQLISKLKDTKELSAALDKVKALEENFAKAENLRTFLKERKTYLRDQLKTLGFAKELKKLNKQAYYYAAQISEYKEVLKDKKKLERKALELLSKSKPFQDFMRRNSQLASLFRMPGGDDGSNVASLAGLQTRASVQAGITERFGQGAAVTQALQQNVQSAQGELSALKAKAQSYSSGSFGNASGDMDMPEGFKPNDQKTKPFLKRLEVGTNIQSQKARYMFPVTSDLGLSLGYKLNDKSSVGVGASYKLGLGTGFNNIRLSHQGAGLRSFIDYKLKGSLFISGGYEQNYRSLISSVEQLKDYSNWQTSGLIGVSKKYKVSKKLKGNMQLLWDFMSYQQIPKTQAILFRIGYSLK